MIYFRVVKPLNQGQSVQVLSGPNKPQNPDFNIQPITLTGSRAGDSRPSDRRLVKRPGEGGQQNVNQPKRLVQPHRSVTTVIRDQTVNDKQRVGHASMVIKHYSKKVRCFMTLQMGDITVHMGDITVQMGDITVQMGDITVHMGDITVQMGDITVQMGDITLQMGG